MNPEAEKLLKDILSKDPSAFTLSDIAFLKARWNYIGRNSRKRLQPVIAEFDKQQKETPANEENEEATNDLGHPADDDGEDE